MQRLLIAVELARLRIPRNDFWRGHFFAAIRCGQEADVVTADDDHFLDNCSKRQSI